LTDSLKTLKYYKKKKTPANFMKNKSKLEKMAKSIKKGLEGIVVH
jgi:hypothetical protein